MLEIGDTCTLYGEKGKSYVVKDIILNDDGTIEGYRLLSNKTLANHWIREENVKLPKKKKGRTKRP